MSNGESEHGGESDKKTMRLDTEGDNVGVRFEVEADVTHNIPPELQDKVQVKDGGESTHEL